MADTASVRRRASELTIGLLYDARSAYGLKVVRGVAAYVAEHGHLTALLDANDAIRRRPRLDTSVVDGLIADLNSPAIARIARASRVPVVGFGVSRAPLTAQVPLFLANDEQIAMLAADHLVAAGFTRFAFCGYADGEAAR
jgi:LacI family transcriptional regulator, galactose operon repressor